MARARKKRSPVWTVDSQEFSRLVASNDSISDILREMGVPMGGGTVLAIKARVAMDGLDMSHINIGRGSNKGKRFIRPVVNLDALLVEHSTISRGFLKKKLLRSEILSNECSECGQLPMWNGLPLVLTLDHINGVKDDNRIENLRILCGHCHSQTDTFAGRNAKKMRGDVPLNLEVAKARKQSEREMFGDTLNNLSRYDSRRKLVCDPIELKSLYRDLGSCDAVARKLGNVSGNTVGKYLKRLGVGLSLAGRKSIPSRSADVAHVIGRPHRWWLT